MKVLKKFWKSVKRNPVINIFVATAVGEVAHDYLEGTIDWDNISVYATTVVMGVLARMFVVPLHERNEAVDAAYKAGMDEGRNGD